MKTQITEQPLVFISLTLLDNQGHSSASLIRKTHQK